MAKTYSLDFRQGTLIDDVSKTKAVTDFGTTTFVDLEKGMALDPVLAISAYELNTGVNAGDIAGNNTTVEVWFKTPLAMTTTYYICMLPRST